MTGFRLREEAPGDAEALDRLITAAFRDAPHSDGAEAAILARLRAAGALTLSLVAESDGELVGQAVVSPVSVDGRHTGWFGLGPVGTAAAWRRRGVASALIRQALDMLRARGAAGCVVLGEPAFYARFGFRHDGRLTYRDTGRAFQALALGSSPPPEGEAAYDSAFG